LTTLSTLLILLGEALDELVHHLSRVKLSLIFFAPPATAGSIVAAFSRRLSGRGRWNWHGL